MISNSSSKNIITFYDRVLLIIYFWCKDHSENLTKKKKRKSRKIISLWAYHLNFKPNPMYTRPRAHSPLIDTQNKRTMWTMSAQSHHCFLSSPFLLFLSFSFISPPNKRGIDRIFTLFHELRTGMELDSSENSSWLFDYGLMEDITVPGGEFPPVPPGTGFSWPSQALNSSSSVRWVMYLRFFY